MMYLDTLIENSCQSIGEAPHWDQSNGTLLYVDVSVGVVHRWDSKTRVDEKYKFDTPVSFLIPRKQGGYIIGLGQQIALFDWKTREVTVLHTVDEGKRTKLNDGKCDASGRLWCGTMGLEKDPSQNNAADVEPNQGSLYCLNLDGTLTNHKEGVTISNGLAWSTDNKTMYFIDSIPRKVFGFDYGLSTGTIGNERVIVDLMNKPLMDYGYPDGMAIDKEDKLWVACYLSGKVFRFDPETGNEIGSISIPARRATSCCFGGPNYDEMFITCGRYGMTEEEKTETPLAGSVFKATDFGAKGLPAQGKIDDISSREHRT